MKGRILSLISHLPPRLRSIPILGSIIVGWLTFLAWCFGSVSGQMDFHGDSGLLVFFAIYPFMYLGIHLGNSAARVLGWHDATNASISFSVFMVYCLFINVGATWVSLS